MTEVQYPEVRVALAHYWFVTWRGGEKVVRSILDIFPNADIYTLFYDSSVCGEHLNGFNVQSSILDKPLIRQKYQKLFPLYPLGVKSLKLRENYDVLISSESGPVKGLPNPARVPHLCYVHTPMRYCWGFTDDYVQTLPPVTRPLARTAFEYLRRYDETTVAGVDTFVANSSNVKERVKRFYGRDASVVYPPISLSLFGEENLTRKKATDRDYYLSFGAITPYKGIDLLIDSFNRSGRKLIVIGDGSERRRLEALSNSNIVFKGSLKDSDINAYVLGAKALLFPGEEDFGMVPLEVMARGIPVIAYGRGGALETVVDSKSQLQTATGIFFQQKTVEALEAALEEFEKIQDDFDPAAIRAHARLFGEDHFKERFAAKVFELIGHPNGDGR